MRLTVWLLGAELLTISTDAPPEPTEADGAHIERHAGEFAIGFVSPVDRSLTPGGVPDAETNPAVPR